MERRSSLTFAAAAAYTLAPAALSADMGAACKLMATNLEPLAPRCCSATLPLSTAAVGPAPSPPRQQQHQQRRPVSVVVGAGPAGILTAVFLARRGHKVHIYDRRPSPLSCDSSDDTRAFVVMLHARGVRALEAAGFDVQAMAAPGSGLQQVRSVALGVGGATRQLDGPGAAARLTGPRHAFVAAMVAQAQVLHPAGITWHWCTTFEAADLETKTASFAAVAAPSSSGSSGGSSQAAAPQQQQQQGHSRCYDLLVAADGGWSRVRRAAEKQVAELSCTMQHSPTHYKVFRSLPPSAALPLVPNAGGSSCGSSSASTSTSTSGSNHGATLAAAAAAAGAADIEQAPQLRIFISDRRSGLPQPGVIFVGCDPTDSTARGILVMPTAQWERQGLGPGAGAEAYAAFLSRHFRMLPTEWVAPMAVQLAEGPLAMSGVRVHASQLHGPSLLLVGDAGHGVTPRTGNGMNAALEDAHVVEQLLGESRGDLATLPERFTAARLGDARALLWLDDMSTVRSGLSCWGWLHPAALAGAASLLARSTLSRATRGWVHPPTQAAMNTLGLPYAQVKAEVQRDNLLAAAAALGAVAALAAACLCRR